MLILYSTGHRDYGYSYCYEYVQYELSMIIIYLDLRRSQLIITTGHCHYRLLGPYLVTSLGIVTVRTVLVGSQTSS